MFKTIFGKYLTSFTIILLACILIIIFVIIGIVSRDSYDMTHRELDIASYSVWRSISDVAKRTSCDVQSVLDTDLTTVEYIKHICSENGAEIYIFDRNGHLVGAFNGDEDVSPEGISSSVAFTMLAGGESYGMGTVDGFFSTAHMNCYHTGNGYDGDFIVLVSKEDYARVTFTREVTGVGITVALWVFLVAFISVYAISRSITKPLTEIVDAAKNYSGGDFSKKIAVTGNDEVAELARAINNMAEALASHEQERNTFLGNVSHDLRTPMTTISGFVDGILDGTIPPEKQEHYLGIISSEVKRLSRLVNSLLEVSRSEAKPEIKPTDFNLSEKARTVLISLEEKITSKNIDIGFDTGDSDVIVRADSDLIHRVVFNLMDNAVKFTQPGGRIDISISAVTDGKKRSKAYFRIRNTGEGIPESEIAHVFERFYKTDRSRGLDKTGTGLGLYIARNIIHAHDEEITLDSRPGEYTEFSFTLPLAPQKQKK